MTKPKELTFRELSELLEFKETDEILKLLADFLDGSQFEEFLNHVKKELNE